MALNSNQDVEMVTLRRSSRIAAKAQEQAVVNNKFVTDIVEPRSKKTATKPKQDTSVKKTKTKTTKRKTAKNTKAINSKFSDLRKTKISDLFCLIQKYALNEKDKLDKYFVVQTIVKGLKENDIKNKLVDLYNNKHKLTIYVAQKSTVTPNKQCWDSVSQHVEDILCYREVDGLDCLDCQNSQINHRKSNQSQRSNEPMDIDMSVLQNGIDTLDALQSIFRRLIV